MPQAGTVRVTGLREALAALNQIQRGAHKQVLGGLMKAAEPVRSSWVGKLSSYAGASTGTIQPKMTTKSIFVVQNAKKVTGRRGDFGALQMRHGLSALLEHEDETRKAAEQALDDLTSDAGF